MTAPPTDTTPTPPSLSDLEDGEVAAIATGILMVRYQLTHDQARTALRARARRARLDPRTQAEQIITSQDTSIRRWASGPATGTFDGAQLERSPHAPPGSRHPSPTERASRPFAEEPIRA